jgi:hypothetical protein
MVALPGAAPPAAQPPPPIPQMEDVSNALTNYLTQFSTWCRRGFAAKLSSNVALPGVLLQACDAPSGTLPKVFVLQVRSDGSIIATPQAIGGANPATPS